MTGMGRPAGWRGAPKGHTTDFTGTVESMQIVHAEVKKAKKGDDVGIRVPDRTREHDEVYRVR